MATTTTTTSNNKLTFRLATKEDAATLARLINTSFCNDTTDQVLLSAEHDRINVTDVTSIEAKMSQPNCAVLVGTKVDGNIAAHCSVHKLDDVRAWFGLLAVEVGTQNRGLGSQVLAYAERYARREWGSKRLEFNVVNTRAELIAWYRNRGYRETGETGPFPYDRHGDWKGVLRDGLHFVEFGKDISGLPATKDD